jgi:hypothetical protein
MANVMTPEFRVSYPNVFKPKKNELNGKDEYSLVALFPKNTDLSKLKAAAQAAIEEKWGKDKTKWPQNLRTPFRDQGEKGKIDEKSGQKILPAGHEEGAIYLNLKSAQKPGVVDMSVQDIINENDFYPGCWARATVNAYAYDQKGNRGVSFGLQNIQKTKEGEPLSGRMKAQAEFQPIEGTESGGTGTDLFN